MCGDDLYVRRLSVETMCGGYRYMCGVSVRGVWGKDKYTDR